jgi:hypothetical protein
MIVKTKAVMKRDGEKLSYRLKRIKGLSGGWRSEWKVGGEESRITYTEERGRCTSTYGEHPLF